MTFMAIKSVVERSKVKLDNINVRMEEMETRLSAVEIYLHHFQGNIDIAQADVHYII